ncbi:Myb-like_DNA-binding domain-containing protein [Hexamita inflata]|uniref:Myb-like DNA-binding domain-containing protein n=1 Tax=Hexamita inflata TaxID=28002 RepID=A0AA86UDZ7_9EUKA|nr:Myb-like DNA-binding domain-containing protein [Hexamita inflata]
MKSEYSFWSHSQKQQLVSFVEQNQTKSGRVDWNSYSNQVEGKSRQQCKSYFTNVLKQSLEAFKEQDVKWNEFVQEFICDFMLLNGDEAELQKKYINLSPNQFKEAMNDIFEIKVALVADIPFIMEYPNSQHRFNRQALSHYFQIIKKYPDISKQIYQKENSTIIMNETECSNITHKIGMIIRGEM